MFNKCIINASSHARPRTHKGKPFLSGGSDSPRSCWGGKTVGLAALKVFIRVGGTRISQQWPLWGLTPSLEDNSVCANCKALPHPNFPCPRLFFSPFLKFFFHFLFFVWAGVGPGRAGKRGKCCPGLGEPWNPSKGTEKWETAALCFREWSSGWKQPASSPEPWAKELIKTVSSWWVTKIENRIL